MDIQTVALDRLIEAPYNPRKDLQPDDPEYVALARSIDRWGSVQPLVWNRRTGHLIAGHQRLKVLRARGATDAQVSVVDLDDADERALNIALNKIGGDWDLDRLGAVLAEISPVFDASLTGFDLSEVSRLVDLVNSEPVADPLAEWTAMPEYVQEDRTAFKSITLHFPDQAAVDAFAALVEQPVTPATRYLWYPALIRHEYGDTHYGDGTARQEEEEEAAQA